MIAPVAVLFLLAGAPPTALDQVKAEQNLEHRAHAAIEFAAVAEKNAESAYQKNDDTGTKAELDQMQQAIRLAQQSLEQSGKKPGKNPKQYKYAEQRSRDLLKRLEALEQRMDFEDRKMVEEPKKEVQEIHDAWLEGIMNREK